VRQRPATRPMTSSFIRQAWVLAIGTSHRMFRIADQQGRLCHQLALTVR
jgi:hypothetical protein